MALRYLNAIAAMTKDHSIGDNGDLLIKNKKDMERFTRLTKKNVVIMGRKTYESLPNGALKDRISIIITRNPDYDPNDPSVIVVNSLDRLDSECNKLAENNGNLTFWNIGGAEIYKALESRTRKLYLTVFDSDETGDTKFPMDCYGDFDVYSSKWIEDMFMVKSKFKNKRK